MIEEELKALRDYIADFDNAPGPEPFMRQSDIQNALRPVLAALEKLAATPDRDKTPGQAEPEEWRDPDGDLWWWDMHHRAMRWRSEARRIADGQLEFEEDGKWVTFESPRASYDGFYRRMWAHFTGEQT